MKNYLQIILLFAVALTACKSKTESTTSSDATVSKFYFMTDTLNPGLGEAVFVVDDRVDTGLIYPKDSLRYGTSLTRVRPRLTFTAVPSASVMSLGDTLVSLTGADTLDFTRQPIYVTVTAADGTTKKVYAIEVYVHQIDPNLYVWEQLTPSICTSEPMEQKALLADEVFYFFTNNGFQTRLYLSTDGYSWVDAVSPTGLPDDCRVRTICYSDTTGLFYYADANGIYSSMGGLVWASLPTPGYEPVTMLMVFNQEPWLVVRKTGQTALHLAKLDFNGNLELMDKLLPRDTLPADFPVYGFASVEYTDKGLLPHALIAGGFNSRGTMVSSAYNIELSSRPDSETGPTYRLTDYSFMQKDRTPFAYRAYVWYNEQIESYGGVNASMQLTDGIAFSVDAGLSWDEADTAVSKRPAEYRPRYAPSVMTDGEYIYLIGGQGEGETYSDAYRARLNSILWIK